MPSFLRIVRTCFCVNLMLNRFSMRSCTSPAILTRAFSFFHRRVLRAYRLQTLGQCHHSPLVPPILSLVCDHLVYSNLFCSCFHRISFVPEPYEIQPFENSRVLFQDLNTLFKLFNSHFPLNLNCLLPSHVWIILVRIKSMVFNYR